MRIRSYPPPFDPGQTLLSRGDHLDLDLGEVVPESCDYQFCMVRVILDQQNHLLALLISPAAGKIIFDGNPSLSSYYR